MSDAREVGILFSGPMVRSLLSGNKTETRRILKPQPRGVPWFWEGDEVDPAPQWFDGWEEGREPCGAATRERNEPIKLRWNVGDRLWVRETFARVGDNDDDIHACPDLTKHVYFRADSVQPEVLKWRPSIFMPRWASRITLEVTAVRVERLQKIDTGDCYAEGCPRPAGPILGSVVTERDNARRAYRELWCSINGPGSWDANPFVSVTTFRRIANTPAIGGAADG